MAVAVPLLSNFEYSFEFALLFVGWDFQAPTSVHITTSDLIKIINQISKIAKKYGCISHKNTIISRHDNRWYRIINLSVSNDYH